MDEVARLKKLVSEAAAVEKQYREWKFKKLEETGEKMINYEVKESEMKTQLFVDKVENMVEEDLKRAKAAIEQKEKLLAEKSSKCKGLTPLIGVEIVDGPECAQARSVLPELPGELSGLVNGDHIIELNGIAMKGKADFQAEMKKISPGAILPMKIKRGTTTSLLQLKVAARDMTWEEVDKLKLDMTRLENDLAVLRLELKRKELELQSLEVEDQIRKQKAKEFRDKRLSRGKEEVLAFAELLNKERRMSSGRGSRELRASDIQSNLEAHKKANSSSATVTASDPGPSRPSTGEFLRVPSSSEASSPGKAEF
jgi:C-terminal processing protease CtpA/Prc